MMLEMLGYQPYEVCLKSEFSFSERTFLEAKFSPNLLSSSQYSRVLNHNSADYLSTFRDDLSLCCPLINHRIFLSLHQTIQTIDRKV